MEILTFLILLALFATVVSLGWGIGSMAHGGKYDNKHDIQFMSARLAFQGTAIVLILIATVISLS